ncbi:MAG: hypothetical protein RH980_18695 [Roseovarius confluentis]|jgi:hypothetical protein
MTTNACPSCEGSVSSKAFDCPHCGHPIRKPKRGFFGKLIKWSFIGFNIAMLAWLVAYWIEVGDMSAGLASEAERTGAAIGGTIGTGVLISFWGFGAVILGLFVLFTRPRK